MAGGYSQILLNLQLYIGSFFPLKEIFRFWINNFLKSNLGKTLLFGGKKKFGCSGVVYIYIFFFILFLYQEVMLVPEGDCDDIVS